MSDNASQAEQEAAPAEVVPIRGGEPERSASLEIIHGQKWWTAPQLAALASIGLGDCPDADRMAFLHLCQSTGLDPFRREIYLLGRKVKDGNSWTVRWTPQTGIDGFRHLAEESGVYGGRVGPQWADETGQWLDVWLSKEPPRAARCGVIRNDRPARCRRCGGDPESHHAQPAGHDYDDERITWATALYDEYVPLESVYENGQKTDRQRPTSMWRKMPAAQLSKCAEAAAIRAAFPRRAAGLYEHAEMDVANQAAKEQVDSERDRQRRELASRPWGATPSGERGVVLGEGEPAAQPEPTYDRTVLVAELEEQARAAGRTVTQYTTRWAAAHKKNIDQATDAELEAFLAPRRDASAAAEGGRDADGSAGPEEAAEAATDAAGATHGLTVEAVQRSEDAPAEAQADREPGDGQASLLGDDAVEEAVPLHQFEAMPDDPGQCRWCDSAPDDADAHLG